MGIAPFGQSKKWVLMEALCVKQ
eukprot:COSAG01_NODE_23522_length_812_cov_0.899018_1_plen_22_part_01